MKIRILENTIRLRLTQSEVEQLPDGPVVQSAEFPSGSLTYSVELSEIVSEPEGDLKSNHIRILLPESDALEWIDSDRTGMENQEYTDQEEGLKILVEKDFQCLHVRRNEDESDAFPNPLANN